MPTTTQQPGVPGWLQRLYNSIWSPWSPVPGVSRQAWRYNFSTGNRPVRWQGTQQNWMPAPQPSTTPNLSLGWLPAPQPNAVPSLSGGQTWMPAPQVAPGAMPNLVGPSTLGAATPPTVPPPQTSTAYQGPGTAGGTVQYTGPDLTGAYIGGRTNPPPPGTGGQGGTGAQNPNYPGPYGYLLTSGGLQSLMGNVYPTGNTNQPDKRQYGYWFGQAGQNYQDYVLRFIARTGQLPVDYWYYNPNAANRRKRQIYGPPPWAGGGQAPQRQQPTYTGQPVPPQNQTPAPQVPQTPATGYGIAAQTNPAITEGVPRWMNDMIYWTIK